MGTGTRPPTLDYLTVMTRVSRRKGSFNFVSPTEEQVCITLHLPDDAPQSAISGTWKPDYAPASEGVPPSSLVDEFEERLDGIISTSKEDDLEAIQWVQDNASRVDREWAERRYERLQSKIERLQEKQAKLDRRFLTP